MGFQVYETTVGCDRQKLMEQYRFSGGFLSNSDAHDLTAILDGERGLDVAELTPRGVIAAVKRLGEAESAAEGRHR